MNGTEPQEFLAVRKANVYIADAKCYKPPGALFDEFWREGELAMLFGASGTGKSLLAVQIADALARGRPLSGFQMPAGRQKVLYVDMELSDAQFHARYSTFRFPERLYRYRPPADVDLCKWLRSRVKADGFQVVVIDSLSALKTTSDGVRETLKAMRELKQLRDELGISILVVADAIEPRPNAAVSGRDMQRSRVLCTVADSVFAIGRAFRPQGSMYLMQTRSRNAAMFWNLQNAPMGKITRLDTGLLGIEFDERFSPELDEEMRDLICTVHVMHEERATFRDIGEMLGISKTRAHKLYQKWTPAMETGLQYVDDEELPVGSEQWIVNGDENAEDTIAPELRKEDGFIPNTSEIPFAAGLKRRSVYDFEFDFDGYGNQIFVETRREHDQKPIVWYRMDRDVTRRFERGAFGIQVQQFAAGPFL